MSKRLQVILDDEEYGEIKRAAERERLSVSDWVRRSLERQRLREPSVDVKSKLEVVRAAAAHRDGPAVDIERMLDEIERGYLGPGADGRV
jgi:hypothetical protein